MGPQLDETADGRPRGKCTAGQQTRRRLHGRQATLRGARETQRQQKVRPKGPKHHCLQWSIATFGSLRDEWPSRRLPVVRH